MSHLRTDVRMEYSASLRLTYKVGRKETDESSSHRRHNGMFCVPPSNLHSGKEGEGLQDMVQLLKTHAQIRGCSLASCTLLPRGLPAPF